MNKFTSICTHAYTNNMRLSEHLKEGSLLMKVGKINKHTKQNTSKDIVKKMVL